MSATNIPTKVLSNGVKIPILGLGTFRLKGEQCQTVLSLAISMGYRMIDTAAVYYNEEDIGKAITLTLQANPNLSRKDLFITSKLAPKDQGYEKALKAVENSIQRLGPVVEYLDLMLIHWPGTQGRKTHDKRNRENRLGSWKALEEMYHAKKIRAIGVSNFMVEHLEDLLESGIDVVPHVNQFEFHPLLYSESTKALLSLCEKHHIVPQAYSSLGEGHFVNGKMLLPELLAIALSKKVSLAQVLLKWGMDKGCIVIPKSSSEERLRENLDAIELKFSSDEMIVLDHLITQYGEKRFCWNPHTVK